MPSGQIISFPWTEQELDVHVRAAVASLWTGREAQGHRQVALGQKDAGTRGNVTGGRHLDGFCLLLRELARAAGFSDDEIRTRTGLEVPGFYRPTKRWDLVVIRRERLCAAVELKSMSGSYGNNLNNRSEEALGSATDIWAAFKSGTLGTHPPWLGYLFVIQDEPASCRPVQLSTGVLPTDPVFTDTSYIERYGILCERMVLERLYSAAAFLAAPMGLSGEYREPRKGLEFTSFARALHGHLVGCGP